MLHTMTYAKPYSFMCTFQNDPPLKGESQGCRKLWSCFWSNPHENLGTMTALNDVGYQRWWYSCLSKMRAFYLKFLVWRCWLKKNAQHENCELSSFGGKIGTRALKKVSQIALRNCSEEVGAEGSVYVILVKRIHAVRLTFWQKASASHMKFATSYERQMSLLLNDFSDFLDRRRSKKLVS